MGCEMCGRDSVNLYYKYGHRVLVCASCNLDVPPPKKVVVCDYEFREPLVSDLPDTQFSVLKSNIRKIPKVSGVYFLFGPDGELLYIGMTGNLQQRLYQHLLGLSGFELGYVTHFSYRVVRAHWKLLHDYETALISLHGPRLNKQGIDSVWDTTLKRWIRQY